jgi:hypothetical protein
MASQPFPIVIGESPCKTTLDRASRLALALAPMPAGGWGACPKGWQSSGNFDAEKS